MDRIRKIQTDRNKETNNERKKVREKERKRKRKEVSKMLIVNSLDQKCSLYLHLKYDLSNIDGKKFELY